MKWQRRTVVWLVVGLLALFLATPVLARGARASFEGYWFPSMFGSPEKIWFSGQDRIQSRGRWQGMKVYSDDVCVEGEWVFYFDEHFDRDFAGHWNGEFHAEIDTPDGPGTWEGRFHGECYGLYNGSGSVIYAHGKGSGALDGLIITAEFVEQRGGETAIIGSIK